MPEIIYSTDKARLDESAAGIIAKSISGLLKTQNKILLAIPGGRSVGGIFSLLAKNNEIPWSKVHIFMVDERLVPLESEESNFRLAKEAFINGLVASGKLPKENLHPFIFNPSSPDSGISAYEQELKKYSTSYDIILLSSGEDGHIGALYPNHHSIKDESEFYIAMSDSPKPPKERMSSSRKLLLKSKVALLLFIGEAKRNAYRKFLDEKTNLFSCPAKLVNLIRKSYVLTDIRE